MPDNDIGLIGLAVMGQNLVLNMADHGYNVAVYNRTGSVTEGFIAGEAGGKTVEAAFDIKDFVAALAKPRKVMIMVKAGPAVDAVVDSLKPYLEEGDIIIDGGNSFFKDTERRATSLAEEGLNFFGMGVSGGEEGARFGPSLMPGGNHQAYDSVKPIAESIAAKFNGEPCVVYLGPRGAGHYVKMVHNGIEYGDMQLIAEAYDLLHRGLGLSNDRLGEVFSEWNEDVLDSFLIEITADIFTKDDPETDNRLIDVILDKARQKGTGKWTSQEALDLGSPLSTINAAVTGRIISAYKDERVAASTQLPGPDPAYMGNPDDFIKAVHDALYASKIMSYAQGFAMLRAASEEYDYNLNYRDVASIWRAGCIIRARFLDDVMSAFENNPGLPNLMLDPFFKEAVTSRLNPWRHVVRSAVDMGIPVPAFSGSLAYYDSYRAARLPANLIQAQRDYFGAHTYERTDRDGSFHTDWLHS